MGIGLAGSVVRSARKVLTNSQILGLSATHQEIVPSPGSGKFVCPVTMALTSNFPVAYASNTTQGDGIAIYPGAAGAYVYEWGFLVNGDTNLLNSFLTTTDPQYVRIPLEYEKFDVFWGGTVALRLVDASALDGLPLSIVAAVQTPFTLGDAANTMTINVLYAILSL